MTSLKFVTKDLERVDYFVLFDYIDLWITPLMEKKFLKKDQELEAEQAALEAVLPEYRGDKSLCKVPAYIWEGRKLGLHLYTIDIARASAESELRAEALPGG